MEEHSVCLYIYDISKGLAKSMSPFLLGKQLDGIWHTAIVVYGKEFIFGGDGIQSCDPGSTILGAPDKIEHLNKTQIPFDMFMDYIHELSTSTFSPDRYHLLNHNCNTFSNEVAQFLTGCSIPAYITDLTEEFLNTQLGAMVRPLIDALSVSPSGGNSVAANRENVNAPAVVQEMKSTVSSHPTAADKNETLESSQCTGASQDLSCQSKNDTSAVTPISYKETRLVQVEYSKVKDSLKQSLNSKEVQLLDEIIDYITTDEPMWSLSSNQMVVIDKILKESAFTDNQKMVVCWLLQECLYHEDVIVMLKHDTNNIYTSVLSSFDQQCSGVKERMTKGLCNCSSFDEGLQWFLKEDSSSINGIRLIAVNICRQCLLDREGILSGVGAALCYNLTRHKIPGELAFDFGCALVELLQKEEKTEAAMNGILALCRCIQYSKEVAALAVVTGLDPNELSKRHPSLKDICNCQLKASLCLD